MKRISLLVTLALVASSAMGQDFIGKAKGLLAVRDTAAAVAAFQDGIKAGQKVAEGNYYLGAIAFAQGRTDDAIRYLEASVRIDDEVLASVKLLGDAYLQKKDLQRALTQYRHAEKLARKDPVVLNAYGQALLAADSIDAAIRVLSLAKEYDPENPNIYVTLAGAYLKQGVVPLGIMNYQRAIELSPKDINLRMQLAGVYEKNRQYTEAVREYDAAIEIDTTFTRAYLQKGKILVAAKQYARAIPGLRRYVAIVPKEKEGSSLLAKALFGAEDYGEAAKAARAALDIDSTDADMWRIYAHSQTEKREYALALTGFTALQRLKAFGAGDQSYYGTALFGLGREEEALAALLAAVAADSTNCDPYFNLGSIYMKRQEYEQAAAMFEKKLGCDARSLSSYINAAACYMQIKNYPRAKELLNRAIELKPDFLQGRLWLGRYYSMVDSLDMAVAEYEEVLKLAAANPERYKRESGEANYLVGASYFGKQQFARSIESFKKASAAGYDNAAMEISWGQAVLQTLDPNDSQDINQGKKNEAARHFRKAIEFDAKSEPAHLSLAQTLVLLRVEGDDEGNRKLVQDACEEYRKVLQLNPRNEQAKKDMERIGCPGAGK